MTVISALTLDLDRDGWEQSRGFIKRDVAAPQLDERAAPADALAVIVQVRYAGLCGSDRGIWRREAFADMIRDSLAKEGRTLRILGHEFMGEIIAAGSQVERLYGVTTGDCVTGDSHVTCGKCLQCRLGTQEVCQDQAILGISIDGIFAPSVKLPAKNLWRVDPEKVRPEICAIYDPMGNAIHALSKVDVRGKSIAIFGCGQIGLFTIAFAKRFGASRIIGIDTNADNLSSAKRLGAHDTILIPSTPRSHAHEANGEAVEAVMKATRGKGVNISFEMAGFNSSVNNCLEVTRPGGEVIFFGVKDGDFTITRFSRMVVKGLTIHNVIGRRIFETWHMLNTLMEDAPNGLQKDIWEEVLKGGKDTVIPLSQYSPELMEARMAEHPKLVFDMQR